MAKAFNLTAQLNFQGPNNIKPIVADIKRQLGSISADVKLNINQKSAKSVDIVTNRLKSMNNVLVSARQNTDSLNASLSNLSSSLSSVSSSGNKTSTAMNNTAISAKNISKNIAEATTEMQQFGKQSALAIRRFAAFSVVTSGVYSLINAINSGFQAFVNFDKELIKLQQVTGKGELGLKKLQDQITKLAISLGVSSESLISVASTLAQAGLNAEETRIALSALAKTELAPSFDNLTDTTEGAIAALRQFELQAGDLESALGSINAVAAAFAVESKDIITAIQRTGGVFAAASKGVSEGKDALNEFIAVFTSVRATTRESAETIATGLRTIFTRIQRGKTIEALKEYGIILTDLEGKFVGPYEAVKRLSEGLKSLDPRDLRFSQIVEELGGFRQIGKVIPLIQQFSEAQKALKIAQTGQSSLTDAQITAQKSLANQIAKVREQFLALIRDVGESATFKAITKIVLGLTSAFISLAGAFKPILPYLAILGTIKGVKAIGEFGTGFFGGLSKGGGAKGTGSNIGSAISGAKENEKAEATKKASQAISENTSAIKILTSAIDKLTSQISANTTALNNARGQSGLNAGGVVRKFASGGVVPGTGNRDTVPAMLTPGEFVIRKKAVETIGSDNLHKMNKYADGGTVESSARELKNRKSGSQALKNLIKNNANKKDYKDGNAINLSDTISFKKKVYTLHEENLVDDPAGFELAVAEKVNGTPTSIGKKDPNFPIDITSSSYGPLEVRNRNRRTSDNTLLDKLIRYYIEENKSYKLSNDPTTDNINLGKLGIVYNSAKLNSPIPNATKLNAGGLVQKFMSGAMVKSLEDMIPSEVLNEAKKFGINVPYTTRDILRKRKNLSNADSSIKKTLLDQISAARAFAQEEADRASSIASTRSIGVVGITGDKLREEATIPGAIGKTGISTKDVPATLQTGTLPPALAKRVQARIRNSIERLIAQVGKEIAKAAGSTPTSGRSSIRSIASKDIEDLVGPIFEKSLGVANASYDPLAKSIDFPSGLKPELARLLGIDPGIMTDVTNNASIEKARDKLGQFGRGRVEARERFGRSQFANGGSIEKFADGGSPEDTVPALLTPGEFVINKKAAKRIGYARLHKMNKADKIQGYNKGGVVDGIQSFANGGFAEINQETADKIKKIQIATTEKYSQQYKKAPEMQIEGSNDLSKSQVKLVSQAEYETEASKELLSSIELSKELRDRINQIQNETIQKYADEYKSASGAGDKAAVKAKAQIEYTTKSREVIFGTNKPKVTKPETLPQLDTTGKNPSADERAFIQYKARKEGMGEGEYRRSLAAKVADKATGLQRDYSGRKEEFKQSLVARRESFQGIDKSTDAGKAQFNSAVAELAKEIQDLNPTLKFEEAQEAAKVLANGLSVTGKNAQDVSSLMQNLNGAIKDEISASDALTMAKTQVAKEQGMSVGTLGRSINNKQVQQEQFIRSQEGQRFGKLAEFAPGMVEKFSKTKLGAGLGKGADFISGKGGRASQLFSKAGGIEGIGVGVSTAAALTKSFMPEKMMKNPNVAGAFGAVEGAGSMGATGAMLGGQVAGPIGALVAGVGGAIIGGIKGFFDAKNNQILANALDKLTASSEQLDIAFKDLAKNDTNKNFKNVQKAFGQQIEASKELENIAFGGTDAMSVGGGIAGGAAAGAVGGAIIGSFIPVIGTAIGAAVGAGLGGIVGGISASQNRANQEEALKGRIGSAGSNVQAATQMAERNMRKMSTEELTQAGAQGKNLIADQYKQSAIVAAELNDKQGKLTAKQKEKIGQDAIETAYLDAYMKQRKEAGATDEQISKDILTDRKKALQAGKTASDAAAAAALKQQQLARATKEVELATQSLLDVYRRVSAKIQKFSNEVDDSLNRLQGTLNSYEGKASVASVDRGSERVLGNMSAYSEQEVKAAVGVTVGKLGGTPEAEALGKQAEAAKFLKDKLPAMLREPGQNKDTVMANIKDKFKDIGLDSGAIDQMLEEIGKKIGEDREGGLGTLADEISTGGIDSLTATAAEAAKTLENLEKTYNDTLQKSIDLQNQYNEKIMQANEYLRKAGSIRINAELDLAKALGNSPTLQQLNQPFDFEIKDLTKGLVASGNIMPGQEMDPAAISRGIQTATEQNQQLQQSNIELQNTGAGTSSADTLAEIQKNNAAMGANSVAINEGRQALEKLANDGTRAANALSKIQEQQKQVEGFGDRIQKIATASPEELFQMNKNTAALQAAQASGPEFFKSRSNRQAAFAGLEQDRSMMTNEEYNKQRAALIRKTYESQGKKGSDVVVDRNGIKLTLDELTKRLEGGVDEADPNVKAYREAVDVQVKANEALANLNKEQALLISDSMLELQTFLADEFPKILTEAITESRTDAETKPETKSKETEKREKSEERYKNSKKEAEEAQSKLDSIDQQIEQVKDRKKKTTGSSAMAKKMRANDQKELERLEEEKKKQEVVVKDKKDSVISNRMALNWDQKQEEKAKIEQDAKIKEEKDKQKNDTLNKSKERREKANKNRSKLESAQAQVQEQQITAPTVSATTKPEEPAQVETPSSEQSQQTQESKPLSPYKARQKQRKEAFLAEKKARRQAYLASLRPEVRERKMTKAEKAERDSQITQKPAMVAGVEQPQAASAQQEALSAAISHQLQLPSPAQQGVLNAAIGIGDQLLGSPAQQVLQSGSSSLYDGSHTTSQAVAALGYTQNQQPIPSNIPQPVESTRQIQQAEVGERQQDKKQKDATAQLLTLDSASLEGLNTFNTNFGSYVDKLVAFQFPVIPEKIEMVGNHIVDVRVTGAAAFESLQDGIKKLINSAIDTRMTEIWNQTGGAMGTRPGAPPPPKGK